MVAHPNPLNVTAVVDGEMLGSLGWAEDGSLAVIGSCRIEENHARMGSMVHELAQQLFCKVEEGFE